MTEVGRMYFLGLGVRPNYQEAFRWFLIAASIGDSAAQYDLGLMYFKGLGTSVDYNQAMKWWQLAVAKQNDSGAAAGLGFAYFNGISVPKDTVHGCELFAQSAKWGGVEGQYNLAYCYESGEGIE